MSPTEKTIAIRGRALWMIVQSSGARFPAPLDWAIWCANAAAAGIAEDETRLNELEEQIKEQETKKQP
jgi:hypothetical protein